ncbi:MAG: hypothetical protein ACYCUI_13655 [Vulcanimicrobiaceae bacterium]
MNREQAGELARLATAFADGETLQIYITLHGWTDWNPNGGIPIGDQDYRWRIKPKAPEPMECWANVYQNGTLIWHKTAEEAEQNARSDATRVAVHLREVMP